MAYNEFKPTIWSEHIQRQLERKCLFWDAVNHQFEGEAKRGEKVKIVGIGRPTIGDYNGTDIGAPQLVDDESQFLEINRAKFFNFGVDDIDKAQSIPGLMDSLMDESAAAMAQVRDEYIAEIAATDGATVSDALTIGDEESAKAAIDEAFTTLWSNDVPVNEQCSIFLPAWYYQLFRGCLQGLSTDNPKLLESGILGKYTNGNVKISNSLFNDGENRKGGYDYAVIMTKRAIAAAGQINEVEAYRPHNLFMDAVKGLDTFGAKVVRPEQIYVIKCIRG